MYASKTPRDITHDPEPWEYFDGTRRHAPLNQHPENPYRVLWTYNPRPEFDHVHHNRPNPILRIARRAHEDGHLAAFIDGFMGDRHERQNEHPYATHARRVLTRLARF